MTQDDLRTNRNISSGRIIVENYFGRMCCLWAVIANKWHWDEGQYDQRYELCMALTKLHIKWHPLRDKDGQSAKQYKSRLMEIGVRTAEKRRVLQRRYRAKRVARMSAQLGGDVGNPEPGAGVMLEILRWLYRSTLRALYYRSYNVLRFSSMFM